MLEIYVKSYPTLETNTRTRIAFTVVELLIVIAIITLVAAVTLPSVKALLHGQKVTQAARMVQAHIESARARAIATGSFVAVILERSVSTGTEQNSVLSLSIGNTFPPYEGDTLGATGLMVDTLAWSSGTQKYATGMDSFYDQIIVPATSGMLIHSPVSAFEAGDFIQIGESQNLFVIKSISSGAITFFNPPYYVHSDGTEWPISEPQLPKAPSDTNLGSTADNPNVPFRIFRKPKKSFVQATKLPRGTCIDLSVSGIQQAGTQFADKTAPLMIVFDERGSVAFVNVGTTLPETPAGTIHLLVGRTEQVAATGFRQSVADPNDKTTFTANLNDAENRWVSINPRSGAVHTSTVQVGSETAAFATRVAVSRAFATNNVVQTAN